MKAKLLVLLFGAALIFAGCESMGEKAKTGAVAGGLIGATAGGVIGYQTGAPFLGAGIGAAVGAVSGGLIGDMLDKHDKEAAAANPQHLSLTQLAELGDRGTADDLIISEIQRTHSVYSLNSEIITYLKQHKVSDKVIDYISKNALAEK